MHTAYRIFILTLALIAAGCVETIPRQVRIDDLPTSPSLKDRNAAVAQAWDRASLDCRAQNKPRGTFCEQLKTEGEFLSCSAEGFAKAAQALRYPAPDKIWVWHNCVQTTANQLKDGFFLSKREIEKRMVDCQAKLDPEPEFPVRQSGWFGPLMAMIVTNDKESLPAVLPGDFGVNQSQVALPSCAARFAAPPQPLAEVKPVPIAAPAIPPAPVPLQQPEPQEESKPTKPSAKPRPRNAVSTADVKATASSNLSRSGSNAASSSAMPELKGACPIPGACGPSVPPDAVKRP